jgi:hypothetical protein
MPSTSRTTTFARASKCLGANGALVGRGLRATPSRKRGARTGHRSVRRLHSARPDRSKLLRFLRRRMGGYNCVFPPFKETGSCGAPAPDAALPGSTPPLSPGVSEPRAPGSDSIG